MSKRISDTEARANIKQLRQSFEGRVAITWFEGKYDSDSMTWLSQWQIIEAFYLGMKEVEDD